MPLSEAACSQTAGYNKAIDADVQFLKARRQSPVNYVIELFEGKDFVILCERSHPKILHYDLNSKECRLFAETMLCCRSSILQMRVNVEAGGTC